MSSLTSPSVNKNTTRFTPQVKQRERRSSLKSIHLATERSTISTSSLTSHRIVAPSLSATQSNESIAGTTSLPETDSLTHSPMSTTSPSKSFTSKSIPSIPVSKRTRLLSSASSNTFQPPSKGEHAGLAAPPSLSQDKVTNFTPQQHLTTVSPPVSQDNNSTLIDHQQAQLQSKRRKRNSTSSKNPKVATELAKSLSTLDGITHDPAEPSLTQKPLSYFMDDLSAGVVSRSFKKSEKEKAAVASATTSGSGQIKKATKNNNSANSIETLDDSDNMDDNSSSQDSPSAPQVRLVDGEIVLDTASLYINKPLGRRHPVDYEVVEEDNSSKRINSHTYGKLHSKRSRRWTKDETDLFYQGLTRHGTDFEMITTMIPTRTRREIKLMFNRQEKVCPWRITASIMKKPTEISPQHASSAQAT